jgi:hypothetical protein
MVCGLIALVVLVGCNEQIRGKLQAEVDRIWSSPARKAETEALITRTVKVELDKNLVGESFEVPGPNPYLHRIKSLSLSLGTKAPVIVIPGKPEFSQSKTHYYLAFSWRAEWKKGNRASLRMPLDMRTHKWWLANEYPDHTVKIRDIVATAEGEAIVVLPKKSKRATATLTVEKSSMDLRADAEGWFWTVNISKQIKKQIEKKVLRTLVGKSVEKAFNVDIPGPR